MTTHETAARLSKCFTTSTRHMNTSASEEIAVIRGDANADDRETLLSMTFDAHQAGISDDYAYSMVREVLAQIADTEPDDLEDTDIDDLVDVYNGALMAWAADGTNWTFCDQAIEEYGAGFESFMAIVMRGQELAYRAALDAVIANWPEEEDGEDDAE